MLMVFAGFFHFRRGRFQGVQRRRDEQHSLQRHAREKGFQCVC